MSQKQGQDFHSNYSDGVKVKISEKYKPPPKINLAISYTQRLSLNKQVEDNMPNYDFGLEISIKDKMKELRAARNLSSTERKEKLEKIKSHRKKIQLERLEREQEKAKIIEDNGNSEMSSNKANYTSGGVLIPTQVNSYTNILTPIPLTNQIYTSNDNDKSPFNISDFDPDTSSPFDNMELKTINDMEELKLVLENDDKTKYCKTSQEPQITYRYDMAHSSNQSYPKNSYFNGYCYYPPEFQANTYDFKSEYSNSFDTLTPQTVDVNKVPFRSAPDIMKALESELNNTHLKNIPNHSFEPTINTSLSKDISSTKKLESLENPFDYLSKDLQNMCNFISDMGFPLPRVARACKELGEQKKILEHLLAMSDLLDLGFEEESVSSALLKCNNDRDKALELLIS